MPEQAAVIACHEVKERPNGIRVISIRFHSKGDSLARPDNHLELFK